MFFVTVAQCFKLMLSHSTLLLSTTIFTHKNLSLMFAAVYLLCVRYFSVIVARLIKNTTSELPFNLFCLLVSSVFFQDWISRRLDMVYYQS